MKNIIKKILVGSISLTIIIIIISAVIVIKNKSLKAEANIETTTSRVIQDENISKETIPEVEENADIEVNETIEEETTIESEIQERPTEEVKSQESTIAKTQSQSTKQDNKISENPSKTTTTVQTNNNDNTNKPKENNTKPNTETNKNTGNTNNNPTPAPTPNVNPETNNSNNTTTTPSNQKVETFKYNKQMTDKMIGVIKANESEYMKQYGYNVVVDESIIANTNQFTFAESRVKNALTYKFGTIKVYARDYYVNGQYMWTECFII